MPRPKSLVKRSEVEMARRRRTCKFSGQAIPKNAMCLVVYEDARQRSCYSLDTALRMIRLARERLDSLESELTE